MHRTLSVLASHERHAAESVLRRSAPWQKKRGDYVRLVPGPEDPPWKNRLGAPHYLNLLQADFTTIVSSRARWRARSRALEARGLLLGVCWVSRSVARHHKRLAALVDAKVVLGAGAKGRSSAGVSRGPPRALAATFLATDIALRPVYIQSESSPQIDPPVG